ncbi:hypothetical protein HHL11_07690 [Ramlibacter sp. G-1-2-2]|uniref:Uncharacterized protein n=1 Tax=Ramlibacter agri TaxID=2728837 RepID=A0A848GY66_9BURK|nr:hypothetical protein [Ramlibacter agri]NML43626.1 hypothetical protein [Ramlibacter agri]
MRAWRLDLPADEYEWELYRRKVGADLAARELNARLAALLEPVLDTLADTSPTWRRAQAARIRDEMHGHMQRFQHLGAADEEPRKVLNRVLRRHLQVNDERPQSE